MREGIVSSCFNDGLAKFHAWRFKTFGDKLIDWRWGSVISFCQKIEALEGPFEEYWDVRKYGDRNAKSRKNDEDDENVVTVQSFSAAVGNKFMWAYARMLRALLAVVSGLMSWCEWCPCHTKPTSFDEDPLGDHMPDPLLSERCPFAGRRGPELAAGCLQGFLEDAKA